jgi:hypothetical protein
LLAVAVFCKDPSTLDSERKAELFAQKLLHGIYFKDQTRFSLTGNKTINTKENGSAIKNELGVNRRLWNGMF